MFDWLDKLREKPESMRFKVAILAAFAVTFVIFLIWLSILTLRFEGSIGKDGETASETISPLSVFRKNISQVFKNGIDDIKNIKDNLESIDYEAIDSNGSQ